MKTLHLYGALAEEFGTGWEVQVETPADAFRLLLCNFGQRFLDMIKDTWLVVTTTDNPNGCNEDMLGMCCSEGEIHIAPKVAGRFKALFGLFFALPLLNTVFAPLGLAGLGGAGAAGAGFLGFGAAGGALGGFGSILLGITILGIGALISGALKPKDAGDREAPDEKPSFLFDGPVNNTEQGGPVPLVYGTIRTGSVVVSGGLNIEKIQT